MRNLAGVEEASAYSREELERCKINVVDLGRPQDYSEVPTRFKGQLIFQEGEFEFTRAWRYWVVKGKVPLELAQLIYRENVCKTDVRAGGHCGAVEPISQADWYDTETGKQIASLKSKKEFEAASLSSEELMAEIGKEGLNKYIFNDNPGEIGEAFVELYHIDSELGLYIFTEKLKNWFN